jgi:hypothetical protein
MDGSDLIKREGESITGCLRWPDGGAMAGKADTSLEFTVLTIPAIIRQTESTRRRVRHGKLT